MSKYTEYINSYLNECKNPFKFSSTDLTDYSTYSSQVNIGKCNLTNEGLDTSVALRNCDNSALMYDREKTQDILKEIINSEGSFKLLGELCSESLKSSGGLTQRASMILLNAYQDTINDLSKKLCLNNGCCHLSGCIEKLKPLPSMEDSDYFIKKRHLNVDERRSKS